MVKRFVFFIFILFVGISRLSAQIYGIVTDKETGEPIPYVNIYYEADKSVGTVADLDGKYSISYHKGWDKLSFSSVGYATQTITVSSATKELNVQMEGNIVLDDIVIKPKRQKYSRKNNPAVELMKK